MVTPRSQRVFTWPPQLTNISHLIFPLFVSTAVMDFPSVTIASTATFSKILTPDELETRKLSYVTLDLLLTPNFDS